MNSADAERAAAMTSGSPDQVPAQLDPNTVPGTGQSDVLYLLNFP